MRPEEILVCTTFASFYNATQILKTKAGDAIKMVLLVKTADPRKQMNEAPWIWNYYLQGIDRTDNPLIVAGASEAWEFTSATFDSITDSDFSGIEFVNIHSDNWNLDNYDATFTNCSGIGK